MTDQVIQPSQAFGQTNGPKSETPADPRPEIVEMRDDWAPVLALLGGTPAMRAAKTLYLPKHPAESPDFYEYRLGVSTLFNGLRKTVDTMSGKPFSEPLKINDDVPSAIKTYCENIDLEGRNLQAFSHEVFWWALAMGLSHILVEYPVGADTTTIAAQKASGARPYFVHIRANQVLGWRSARVRGVETLTQLRYLESVEVANGVWGTKIVQQVRLMTPTTIETFRQNEKNVWVSQGVVPNTFGGIPLATVYTGRTGFMTACPPLLDLAYLNIEHWQSSSDQSNILHVARVPILFGKGFSEDTAITVGTQKAVANPDVQADLKFVEHSGAAIEAGRVSIQDIEDRMRVLGAQLLVKNGSGNRMTATEKSIDSAEADSALSLAALNLQDSLGVALQYMAQWEKLPEGGSVSVYRDFDEVVSDGQKGDILIKLKQEGIISAETGFEEAIRLGVVSEGRLWSEELSRFEKEGPPRGVVGNYEAPPGGPAGLPPTQSAPIASTPAGA